MPVFIYPIPSYGAVNRPAVLYYPATFPNYQCCKPYERCGPQQYKIPDRLLAPTTPEYCHITSPPAASVFPTLYTLHPPASSYERALLPLPTSDPAVTAAVLLPPAPAAMMHVTPVSDAHTLPSQPELPPRTAPLATPIAPPSPVPTIVAPRPAPPPPLPPSRPALPMSADTSPVDVPAHAPIVTTPDTLPPLPATALRHTTPVHDTHPLLSHALAPTRAPPLHPPPPPPASHSRTPSSPRPASPRPTFAAPTLLNPPPIPYVAASDTLPVASPTVTPSLPLPPPPRPVRHTTELSAHHAVASAPVCPARPATLPACSPSPPPLTPTAASQRPAAPAPLLLDTLDPCHASYESPIDTDPAPPPAVTATALLSPTPLVRRPRRLVSDTHSLPSPPLAPHRPRGLTPAPNPPPHTSDTTCLDQPPAPLAAPKLLTDPPSYVNASDTVPIPSPPVSAAPRLPPRPAAALHATHVSPDHTLASNPDPPTRPRIDHTSPSSAALHTTATPHAPPPRPSPLLAPPCTCIAPPDSRLITALRLPCPALALTLTPRLPPPPRPGRHRIDVSDPHLLTSHAEPPTRPRTDPSRPPRPCPATVTAPLSPATPASPPLVSDTTLSAAAAMLHASVLVLTTTPAVADNARLRPPPSPA